MSDTIEARADYNISNLLPSKARWLTENIEDQDIKDEFLDKLKTYLHITKNNAADLDQIYCLTAQLKKENILSKISDLDIAKALYSCDAKVINSFLSGLNTRRKNLVKAALDDIQLTEKNALVGNLADAVFSQLTNTTVEFKEASATKYATEEWTIARTHAGRFLEKRSKPPKRKSSGATKD